MYGNPPEHRVAIARNAVTAYVALGANLGDAVAALQQAAEALAHLPMTRLRQASSVYKTAPIDTDSGGDTPAPGGDYFNAVVALETGLTAPALLDQLQQLEQQAGRERPYQKLRLTGSAMKRWLRCSTSALSGWAVWFFKARAVRAASWHRPAACSAGGRAGGFFGLARTASCRV